MASQSFLVPKNWRNYQHYKDRRPPWIKLHRDLLEDRKFMLLPLASKALAPLLWLLASEGKNGSFNADYEELAFRLHISLAEIQAGMPPLITAGFFIPASGMDDDASNTDESASANLQDASNLLAKTLPEYRERERVNPLAQNGLTVLRGGGSKKPNGHDSFNEFWLAYPKKKSKRAAEKAWLKLKPCKDLKAKILLAIERDRATGQWQKDGGQFIPYPASWLTGRRWEDEIPAESHDGLDFSGVIGYG